MNSQCVFFTSSIMLFTYLDVLDLKMKLIMGAIQKLNWIFMLQKELMEQEICSISQLS
jgi:hypothetical protein